MTATIELLPRKHQQGAALIIMTLVLAIILTAFAINYYKAADLTALQNKKTEQALAEAKQALLAYAAEPVTRLPNVTPPLTCGSNCPRPGDLPCPDTDNDGDAETLCGTNPASRLGRLPWKTLGIDDIRDGSGERLWYAVSNQYKNNPRLLPLNSESLGTISYRNTTGNLVYDATAGTGLAAVVIAPGDALTRSDGVAQDRTSLPNKFGNNTANNYLDIAFGEDNASFTESTVDGFISGKVNLAGQKILNDVALPITRDEMNAVMEPQVLAEVMQAVLYNFCPVRVDIQNRTCTGNTANDYLSDPASATDPTCLGNGNIANDQCVSDATISFGRIAIGGNPGGPTGNFGWEHEDKNSILRGQADNNWFQQNGWRELIFYAVAPACTQANTNCSGNVYLTLNNALTPLAAPSPTNKKIVLISAGRALSSATLTQLRATNADKTTLSNYLENILPPDNTFSRYIHNADRNDRVISIP